MSFPFSFAPCLLLFYFCWHYARPQKAKSPWDTHLRSSYSSLPFFESPDDWKAATIEDRW